MKNNNLKKYIKSGFEKLNINLNQKQLDQFNKYVDFLIKENKKYNLTSITDPKEVVKVHFLDSAGIFKKEKIKGKVIDIGTGAGFPGFVFKILNPEIKLTLLESSLKKVKFLKMLQIELKILEGVEVLHDRAEDLGQSNDYRKQYNIVTSRAVAPLNILLEYTVPFCSDKGQLLLYKGPSYEKELKEAKNSVEELNLKLDSSYKLDIPLLTGERYILKFIRVGPLKDRYPRRPGIPKKRPL